MWVKFTAPHKHRFTPQMYRRYVPGQIANLPTPVAKAAIDAGHAVKMKRPNKHAAPEVDDGEGRG